MRRLVCLAVPLALAACQPEPTTPGATVDRVEVTPAAPTIQQGASTQLHATAVWSDGLVSDVTERAAWASSAESVVQVSSADGSRGLAVGRAVGPATVTATLDGLAGAASVTVVVPAVVSVLVEPSTASLAKGRDLQLTATATYGNGTSVDVTRLAAWTTDAPAVAALGGSGWEGVVHAAGEGTAQIAAELDGVAGAMSLTVTPATLDLIRVEVRPIFYPGVTSPLAAIAVYSDREVDVTADASWAISPEGVVTTTFGAGGAVVRAVGVGVATFAAGYLGLTGSATVQVSDASLAMLDVSPGTATLVVGGTLPLRAIGSYDAGRTMLDLTDLVTWSGGSPLVATLSDAPGQEGVLTGLGTGQTVVTAEFGGRLAHGIVVVTAPGP